MPSIPTRQDAAAITDQDKFIDLVCSDEELLRPEFDAIIAAEWASPPPAEPARTAPASGPHRVHLPRPSEPALPPRGPQHPGIGGWVRQRSPP